MDLSNNNTKAFISPRNWIEVSKEFSLSNMKKNKNKNKHKIEIKNKNKNKNKNENK